MGRGQDSDVSPPGGDELRGEPWHRRTRFAFG